MNPISKKIYNKLSEEDKTELKSEKIELASVQEIGKLANQYFRDTDTAISKIKGLVSESRAIANKLEQAIKLAERMERELPQLEKQARDLGINPDNINELGEAYIATKDAINIKKVINTLNKFHTTI